MIKVGAFVKHNRIGPAAQKFEPGVERLMDRAVNRAIQAADPVTRVRTGDLRDEKKITKGDGERTITWLMDYAAHQDQGTTKISGTHFTRAAAKAAEKSFNSGIKDLGL